MTIKPNRANIVTTMKDKNEKIKSKKDRALDTLKKHPIATSLGLSALLATGAFMANNNHTPARFPDTTISQEAASIKTVEIENDNGEKIRIEVDPLGREEALEILKSDLEGVEFRGVWWIGGEIDENGKTSIFGGTGIDNLDQYEKEYIETDEYNEAGDLITTATQTVADLIKCNPDNPEQVKAYRDLQKALKQAQDAAERLSKAIDNNGSENSIDDSQESASFDLQTANKDATKALRQLIKATEGNVAS